MTNDHFYFEHDVGDDDSYTTNNQVSDSFVECVAQELKIRPFAQKACLQALQKLHSLF